MRYMLWLFVAVATVASIGCGNNKELLAQRDARIAELENELVQAEQQLQAEEQRAAELNKQLEEALADYREKEQVWLEQKNRKSVITVSDAVLFKSGSVDILEEGKGLIDRIASVASQHPDREILIEGHTDAVPIGEEYRDKYQSNWELSAGRACSVLRYMYWKHKIPGDRLAAVGYGEHRPIADNETPEGRQRNRRVVITIGEAATQ